MFVVLAVIVALGSLMTVMSKSIVRAATYLLVVLLGTAGLYFLMGYTFLGSVQTMVYAGGVIVLYVFAILLTRGQTDKAGKTNGAVTSWGLLLALAGVVSTLAVVCTATWHVVAEIGKPSETTNSITMDTVGHNMISTEHLGYVLPFEAVSVLLLACIVAGIVIARKR